MLPTLLEPTIDDLRRLLPSQAVDLLRDMLHAEAETLGVKLTGITVSSAISVPDGGIDATVEGEFDESMGHGIIFSGRTYYQVKTGAFSAGKPNELRTLLLKPAAIRQTKARGKGKGKAQAKGAASVRPQRGKISGGDLNDGVRECLDQGGTFVVVIFGNDSPKPTVKDTEKALKKLIVDIDKKYKKVRVRVWRPNQISKLSMVAPGSALKIRGIRAPGNVHDLEWMGRSSGFEGEFLADSPQIEAIEQIRKAVANPKIGLTHVRVVGDPGIGKTRLVYEALSDARFKSKTLYFASADELFENDLLGQIDWSAKDGALVLVVDECDSQARVSIHQKLRYTKGAIALVSIYSDLDDQDSRSPDYIFIDPPKLSDDRLGEILEGYGVPKERAKWLAPLFGGSPRVAHAIGSSIKASDNMEELLRPKTLDNIWDHYIAGKEGNKSSDYLDRHVVLCCLALFRRFGWGGAAEVEARAIYDVLIKKLSGMSWARFRQVVDQLRARKIIQGQTTLYISPRLLHVKLWYDWWERYGSGIGMQTIVDGLPKQLLEWLYEMFVYAKESEVASRVVEQLLAPNGMFTELTAYAESKGGQLFFALAQVKPKAASRVITQALEKQSADELTKFVDGRRQVVHALEHAALYGNAFELAAKALLRLAESENETWSNNATGVFAGLFTLGYGRVASTELPPSERLPILLNALRTRNGKVRKLALKAFDQALSTNFIRMSLGDAHGLRGLPKGWSPKTYGELHQNYLDYMESLWTVRSELEKGEQIEAENIVLGHARALIRMPLLREPLLQHMEEISRQGDVERMRVVEKIVSILHYDRKELPKEAQARLESIYAGLVGESFQSRLKRFVGLQLLEDHFDDAGNHLDGPPPAVLELVQQALNEPEKLMPELPWLVTGEARNGYAFGQALGGSDIGGKLWSRIFAAWEGSGEHASDFFVGGYLAGIFFRDPTLWGGFAEQVLRSTQKEQALYVIWRSGMTDNVAKRILEEIEAGVIDVEGLQTFAYGSASRRIPASILAKMLELLISKGTYRSLVGALELWDYGLKKSDVDEKIKWQLCRQILGHRLFFTKRPDRSHNTMVDHHWKVAALGLSKFDLGASLELARLCLEHLGEDGTVVDGFRPQAFEFLDKVVRQSPQEVWKLVTDLIGPPETGRAYHILSWLRGELGFGGDGKPGAFSSIPSSLICDWIDENSKERAPYIARHVPKELPIQSESPNLFRLMLERYGKDEEVRNALHANFHTEGWSGSASAHYRGKLASVEKILQKEKSPSVVVWLQEEKESLIKMIKSEEATEERRGF